MLKHKLKKTTDKIGFGRRNTDKKKNGKEVLYSKVRKSEGVRDKLSTSITDGGYFTGPESSFYDVPDNSQNKDYQTQQQHQHHKQHHHHQQHQHLHHHHQQHQQQQHSPQRNAETHHVPNQQENVPFTSFQLPVTYFMPVDVVWRRRATPHEDFIFTSEGIKNLVLQQQSIVNDISLNMQSFSAPSKTDDAVKKPNPPMETREEVWKKDFENLEKSSMAKLRRLLEIEEMAKFSQNLRF